MRFQIGADILLIVAGFDPEFQADLLQQFPSPRGCRGQYYRLHAVRGYLRPGPGTMSEVSVPQVRNKRVIRLANRVLGRAPRLDNIGIVVLGDLPLLLSIVVPKMSSVTPVHWQLLPPPISVTGGALGANCFPDIDAAHNFKLVNVRQLVDDHVHGAP